MCIRDSNRLCASGLEAVTYAARMIKSNEADLVIAGGVESMSRAPFVIPKSSSAFSRNAEIYDTTIGWRFINPIMNEKYGVDSMPETGENVAELHLHGSSAVVSLTVNLLNNIKGLRLAEAGEFTRRSLDNGKIDLAQVEGLADLIDAETTAQHKQAVRVFTGALGKKIKEWRQTLIKAAALLVATIDFSDEEVPEDVTPEVEALINKVISELDLEIVGVQTAERIRAGFEVAIVGAPNLGKSTLLNFLAGRDAAITSNISGTTRDIIEVKLDLRGLPVTILDTAGIRESVDAIEEIGISRALERSSRCLLYTSPSPRD